MTDLVVVPRLRRLLSERRLALDEFHRRLVARGDAPSRAALGRLAQERPVEIVVRDPLGDEQHGVGLDLDRVAVLADALH